MWLQLLMFVFLFAVTVLCIGLGHAILVSRQKNHIRNMLRNAEPAVDKQFSTLLKPESGESSYTARLKNVKLFNKLESILRESGSRWTLSQFLFFSLAAGAAGVFLGTIVRPFSSSPVSPVVLGPASAVLPFLVVKHKRTKRLAAFEEQFPEALNFLARSMRAGHGFSSGLEMLVADASEPLSSCFRQVLSELRLGSPFDSAIHKLTVLAPLIDVRFFVSAVLLQQGSGGNLAEILDSMAQIIRERFRLKGQIRASSAHGRLTGGILIIMPVVVALLMLLTSPDYILMMFRDPTGKKMILAACCGQVLGYFFIRKIVNFKV